MKKYIIERKIPEIGSMSESDLDKGVQKSCNAIDEINHSVQWIESFHTDDKSYCIYLAESPEAIKEHAKVSGFPANSIMEVQRVVDPSS